MATTESKPTPVDMREIWDVASLAASKRDMTLLGITNGLAGQGVWCAETDMATELERLTPSQMVQIGTAIDVNANARLFISGQSVMTVDHRD